MSEEDARSIALATFQRIQSRFPHLAMDIQTSVPNVEVAVDIPQQPGLVFTVHLNLQNSDELHLGAGGLWVSWFPCHDLTETNDYFEAVCGVLSGEWRILERLQGSRPVRADLQRPVGSAWKTVATSSFLHLPVPWARRKRVLQNVVGV